MMFGRRREERPRRLRHANSVVCGLLRHVFDVGPGEAEVVQLALGKARKFANGGAIAAPFLNLVGDLSDRHGFFLPQSGGPDRVVVL